VSDRDEAATQKACPARTGRAIRGCRTRPTRIRAAASASAPRGVAGATAIGIGYAFGGPAGAVAALGIVLLLAVAWWVARVRRR